MSNIIIPEDILQDYTDRTFLVGYLIGILFTVKAHVEIDRPEIGQIIDERLAVIEPKIKKLFYAEAEPKNEPDGIA